MKVLFVSDMTVNKSVSSGNTFLNIFNGINNVEKYSIQTRGGAPDESIKRAFLTNEKQIVNKLLKWNAPVGKEITGRYTGETYSESKTIKAILRKRWSIFFLLQNIVWSLPFWKSKSLKKFLDEVQPDVIFTKLKMLNPLNKLIRFVVKYTNKPLMLYAWDDNYSYLKGESLFKKIIQANSRKHMRKTIKLVDKLYVISKIQQRDYEEWFNKPCKILAKYGDFSAYPILKKEYGKPLQVVYTGNILLNRWRSLEVIANAMQKINVNGIKAQLKIYTSNTLTEKMGLALNKGESSIVMGSIPASEVSKIQQGADMLVHVEGLDEKNAQLVRHSFSTKLVDYFKMARPILAVGPRGVASIEHLIENDCAIYASDENILAEKLLEIINDKEKLDDLSLKAFECGKLNHSEEIMRGRFIKDLNEILNKEISQ